jgi:hypothetical protein
LQVTIRPLADPASEIDLTQKLIAAIAEELWKHSGEADVVNWLEAEFHLKRLLGSVPLEADGLRCAGCPVRTRIKRHAPTIVAPKQPTTVGAVRSHPVLVGVGK